MPKLDGIILKAPKAGAPGFVKGQLSFKVDAFIASLKEHQDKNWVNMVLKESKGGELYLELDTWKPAAKDDAP